MRVTVVLCTHAPRADYLEQTLGALRGQSLPLTDWELLIVDNASAVPVQADLAWHPHGRLLREPQPGLAFARKCGITHARGEIIVFCDDDNLLAPHYLARAIALFEEHRSLGAAGGPSVGRYETPPPDWFEPFSHLLAVRHFGDAPQVASWRGEVPRLYPGFAPIGAGLVIHREAALVYASQFDARFTDRTGDDLGSGGDNALVLAALRRGWSVGYFPDLELVHLISAARLRPRYLAQLSRASMRSWVRLLGAHGLSPWTPVRPRSVPWRKLRAFLVQRPWQGWGRRLRFAAACGQFEGRARLHRDAA